MTCHKHLPRISVLTPSYNQGRYLEQNIQSVMRQSYPEFEHIVIDGGSTDGTVEILQKYPHLKWVSERDEGQADALNKGLAMATGDIIGWINSDDYYEQSIFQEVACEFANDDVRWVVGGICVYVEASGKCYRCSKGDIGYETLLRHPHHVRQQAGFYRRALLESVGGWDSRLFMVMDYDLWLRLAKRHPPKEVQSDWGWYRICGGRKSSGGNIMKQAREIGQIWHREGVPWLWRTRYWSRNLRYTLKAAIKGTLARAHMIGPEHADIPLRHPGWQPRRSS